MIALQVVLRDVLNRLMDAEDDLDELFGEPSES